MDVLNREVTTKVKHLLGTIFVAFVCFGFITWQVRELQEADRQTDLQNAADAVYEAQVRSYDNSVVARNTCLMQIDMLDSIREGFIRSAESNRRLVDVVAQFGASEEVVEGLYEVVTDEIADIGRSLPVLSESSCESLPQEPIQPYGYTFPESP